MSTVTIDNPATGHSSVAEDSTIYYVGMKGADQASIAEVGTIEDGSPQIGIAKVSANQQSIFQVGSIKESATQVGTAQIGTLQVGSQAGTTKVGINGGNINHVSIRQVSPFQVSTAEIDPSQVSHLQNGSTQVRSSQVHSSQIGPTQINPSKIPLPSSIPSKQLRSIHNSAPSIYTIKDSALSLWTSLLARVFRVYGGKCLYMLQMPERVSYGTGT